MIAPRSCHALATSFVSRVSRAGDRAAGRSLPRRVRLLPTSRQGERYRVVGVVMGSQAKFMEARRVSQSASRVPVEPCLGSGHDRRRPRTLRFAPFHHSQPHASRPACCDVGNMPELKMGFTLQHEAVLP